MLITVDLSVPFPRSLVYITYRDKLLDFVSSLPNVRSVEARSRRQENGLIYSVNVWHGGGQIPLELKTLSGKDLLSWTEYNTWDESNFTHQWRIETHACTKAVFCQGQDCFWEDNGMTRIETRGELKIAPEHLEGFPQFLQGRIASIVENFLGNKILPNLRQISLEVARYLKQTV